MRWWDECVGGVLCRYQLAGSAVWLVALSVVVTVRRGQNN